MIRGKAKILNNIGFLYKVQDLYDKPLPNSKKLDRIYESEGCDEGIAISPK